MMGHSESTVLAVVVDPGRLAAGIVDQRGEVLVRDRIGTPTREVWRALEQLVRDGLAEQLGSRRYRLPRAALKS